MKINDIPQLIHVNQGVNWDFCDIQYTLDRFQKTYGLDLDPEFQRGHVWDLETKTKFIEYILRGGIVQPIRFNSPVFGGHPHSKVSDLSEDIVLVDGKQRLTAILEFINDDLLVFGGVKLSSFDDPKLLLRRAHVEYQVNKLQTKNELYQWYLEMNEGQVAHTKEELDRVRNLIVKA